MQYEASTIEAHGIPHTEYRHVPEVTERYPGAELINAASNPQKANRYLVTLVNRWTEDEKLLDVLIDGQGFTALIQEVRRRVGMEFEIFEWIDTGEPF